MSRLNVRGLDPAGGVDGQVPVISGGKFVIGNAPGGGSGGTATYADFTPNLTAATTNPTLGTGSVKQGRYVQIGKHVEASGGIRFGTSGNAGSGEYHIDLPVAAAVTNAAMGYAWSYTNGAGVVTWVALQISSTRVKFFRANATTFAMSSNIPVTWGTNGDEIGFHFSYEAA